MKAASIRSFTICYWQLKLANINLPQLLHHTNQSNHCDSCRKIARMSRVFYCVSWLIVGVGVFRRGISSPISPAEVWERCKLPEWAWCKAHAAQWFFCILRSPSNWTVLCYYSPPMVGGIKLCRNMSVRLSHTPRLNPVSGIASRRMGSGGQEGQLPPIDDD